LPTADWLATGWFKIRISNRQSAIGNWQLLREVTNAVSCEDIADFQLPTADWLATGWFKIRISNRQSAIGNWQLLREVTNAVS
jgi:hypothetical protein